ncbi:MAG: helix-turn-helix transcriptional regulator [Ginsengibacter sp.]
MKLQSKAAKDRSEEIVNNIYSLMYISDNRNKTIVWCNRNLEKETGYALMKMREMGIAFFKEVMHPDDFLIAQKTQQEFSQNNRAGVTGFCRFRKENTSEWRIFFGTAAPFSYTEKGDVKEVCCLFQLFPPILDTPEQAKIAFQVFSNEYNRAILNTLTQRETTVLQLLKEGNKAPAIAKKLFIGYETVRKCLTGLREKFNVHTIPALVTIANKLGL